MYKVTSNGKNAISFLLFPALALNLRNETYDVGKWQEHEHVSKILTGKCFQTTHFFSSLYFSSFSPSVCFFNDMSFPRIFVHCIFLWKLLQGFTDEMILFIFTSSIPCLILTSCTSFYRSYNYYKLTLNSFTSSWNAVQT